MTGVKFGLIVSALRGLPQALDRRLARWLTREVIEREATIVHLMALGASEDKAQRAVEWFAHSTRHNLSGTDWESFREAVTLMSAEGDF